MLGIIILNYITYKETVKCVKSILDTIENMKISIYIVDNASPNDSYNILKAKYKSSTNIKIIPSKLNGGYSSGNNIGINACLVDGIEYAIISNNDVIFTRNSIQSLFNYIKQNHDAIIVGPRIIDINGNFQKSISLKKQSFVGFLFQNSFIKASFKELKTYNPFEVYTVSGCCFIANLKKFKQIGAFDQSTFLYNEENILGSQIEKSKYKVIFCPRISIIHAHGSTTGRENMFINKEFMKSSLYYWSVYRKKSKINLCLIWTIYTLKWGIKAIFVMRMRKYWIDYFKYTSNI